MASQYKKRLKLVFISIVITFIIIFCINVVVKVKYPLSYKGHINKYAQKYNVDPYLVAAIINVESNFDVKAKSSKDARGLMQISPITANWAAKELELKDFKLESLYDPETNIMIGCWYINVLRDEYGNNLTLILAAYNGGSGNVNKWLLNKEYSDDEKTLKKIPFKETKDYVEKVLKNYNMYEKIYGDKLLEENSIMEFQFPMVINNLKKLIKGFVFQYR